MLVKRTWTVILRKHAKNIWNCRRLFEVDIAKTYKEHFELNKPPSVYDTEESSVVYIYIPLIV